MNTIIKNKLFKNSLYNKTHIILSRERGFLLLAILFTTVCSYAQVTVTGALVGNGTYTTLGAAFTAINGGAQTGATIGISITANTDELAATAALNAGAWTSLTITPDGARTITGATTAGNPLINFNGADNVTINGLNTGGNSLTISNTTVSATAGTSTIRFINDASNNTITNCTISGSSTLATTGTIVFSTGTTTGNDGNTISNCAINPAGSNLPVNAVYSAGSSTTIDNSGNTIHNNTIQDYFSPTLSSAGILLASNSAAWTITNNKLFQTATRTLNANALSILGIGVITASAGGYTINNNTIGYANASATGTTTYDGAFTTVYRGIDFTGNTTTSNIQGNTIAGIRFTTSSTSTTALGVFSGIAVSSGSVNIGTTTANTIGSATDTGSIVINNTTTTAIRINGIYVAAASATAAIQNNIIGGFTSGTGATFAYSFIGISTAGAAGNFTVRNNTIGSTTLANSITMGDINTTTGVCTIQGISNAATGTISIDSNTVANTTVFGTAASTISGIVNGGGSAVTINANLITNASVTGLAGTSFGINNSAAPSTLSINSNTIRNFSITNTTAIFTAISNSGAATSSIAIDDNKLGDATGGLITYTVANSGAFTGISNSAGTAASSLSIQNNDIRGIVHAVAGSSAHLYIINSAATLSQNISGNTFTNLSVNTTGGVTFISNNVALPASGTQTISNNSIVTGYAKTGAGGTVTLFSTGSTSIANTTIINNGNNFSNITVTGATILTGWSQLDLGLTTKAISNNTFSNWTAGTGTVTVMTLSGFGNTSAIANNTISSITGQGAIIGLTIGATGNATALNVNGNTITGLSSTGTGSNVTALASANLSTAVNIFSNNINTLSSSGASATVTGINVTDGTGTVSIYSNVINTISGTGATSPVANGLAISGATTDTVIIYKNKVYDIAENAVSAGATANGISITGGRDLTCYNNIVGDIKAPSVSGTYAVRGILINSTVVNSTYRLSYNSVYLNATSTGANFGSYGLGHTTSATATTANLILNNNVIINASTANGTGVTTALFLSSAALANYDLSSNNNLFYAGIPGSRNALLTVATTNYSTLNDLQGIVLPREVNSASENTSFLSTVASNSNFLKPDTTVASAIESGGVNISGITTDYEDDIRQGNAGTTSTGTAPDIGAFEQNGIRVINPVVVTGALAGNGTYATLGSAFNAINSGAQTSANIAISIRNNTDELTSTAVLNAGAWTSLTISPVGARTVTGATTAGNPLINLNGADNVTINGLNTGGNSLTISNTTVSATAGTSTIRFINDASNNTITNCTISGSSTLATSGTIFFSTGTTTGNDGNTISNCAVNPAGSNLPVNAVYSAGTSVAIDNSGNTIHNNTIQDYFSPTLSSAGILLASNSAAWTISNNRLFQTATRTINANALTILGIGVITASAGGYTINNNTIGYANASATGTTTYDGVFTTVYRGIDFTGNTTTSNIQGNTIAGIRFTTSSTSATVLGVFSGIAVSSGSVNIGTTTANTIGSATDTGSIVINNTTTTAIRINGIYVASASATAVIQNNIIGGFTSGTGATFGYNFIGIATVGTSGNFNVRNNTIGSTTLANSITMGDINTTTGVCTIQGISNAATGTISIDSNTVANTAVFGTGTSTISGIVNGGGSAVTINANLITNASVTGLAGTSLGINNTATPATLSINRNTIRSFSISNTTGVFTAISNSGAVSSAIAIDSNKLGDTTGDLITYTVANSGAFTGISNSAGTAASSLSIQNNDMRGIVHSVAGSSAHLYIINSAATLSQNISGNTFTNLSVNTTGGATLISNNVALAAGGTQTISNNSIVTGYTKTGAGGTVTVFSTAATSNATAIINNNGNNFSNITVSGATILTGWSQLDIGLTTKTVSGNTFSNWTAATGAITVMTLSGFGNTSAIANNTISSITGQSSITGLTIAATGNATALNINGNTITGLSSTGTGGAVTALASANNSTAVNIFSNAINNLSSSGASVTVTGISVTGGTGTISVYTNEIKSISGTGATSPVANGLAISGATTDTVIIYKNKVYDIAENAISAGATVHGLSITSGIYVTCYNNLVGDIKAPNVSGTSAVRGILINSTVVNSTYRLYYNSVYLNATSTGTNFGSYGLGHTTSATATTANLILNNNVIVNASAANGTGFTTALFLSSAALANYDLSSNNNLFYAGIPGSKNVLLTVATTNYSTLNDLQGIVLPREVNSASENTSFLSTVASNSNFLKPDTTVASAIESGGVNISGITTDYEDDIRQGNAGTTSTGTAPDIGAFEQNGIRVINPVVVTGALAGNGTYPTLGSAFNAINSGAQTSAAVTISIRNNTDELTSTAVLNAGAWTSLTITPVGARSVTGATTAGNPLINLNGADNVTINGLNTGGNSLAISNTTVSATAGTSTIRFINDASNNTITNCTISGSSTLATSGTIFFSTGTTTGNDGNTISNCAVNPAGTNLPVNAIYSAGSSTTIDNSGNTIHNNTIQDYFSPTLSSAGILLASNSAAWTITNNRLFQTATRTINANALTIRGIGVITASAGGYNINNNIIGYSNTAGTGTTIYNGVFTSVYRGIDFTGNTTTTNIQGNTIAGVNFTTSLTSSAGTSGLGVFSGIAVSSGRVNIGTTAANTIGSATDSGSIVINNTTTSAVRINGIYVAAASTTAIIQNNTIGGFSTGTGATFSYSFIGIATAGSAGVFSITNNTIGSTTRANSIAMGNINTTTGICTIQGINNAATAQIDINNNTLANAVVFGTGNSTIFGILNTAGTAVNINSNLITNASAPGSASTSGTSHGFRNTFAVLFLSINNNTIRNFNITNTTGTFTAISNTGAVDGSITIDNNNLGDTVGGLITYTAANSSAFTGISNSGGGVNCALSIQNNNVSGIVHAVAGSSAHTYIINSAATGAQNISGNTFTNISVNTTGGATFISNNVALAAGGTQTISNNRIVTGYAKTGAGGTVTVFTTAATSNATTTINNNGNNFSNITVTGATVLTGWSQLDIGLTTKNISNNTFSNWTAGTGTVTVMTLSGFGNTSAIANNTISSITGQGAIIGLTIGATGNATALNVNGNTITGLSSTGTGGTVTALASANNSNAVNIFSNAINNLSSSGASVTVTGINVTGGTGTISVYTNEIKSISGTGATSPVANGIAISGATTDTVIMYKNKIYDLAENGSTTGAAVNGLSITGGIYVTCYNNLVGDIKAPNVSGTAAVRGILINSTLVNSTYRLYYNSVYLNATSTGTNFGSYGLYHAASATATTARLILNNNVIINTSTSNGTGLTIAYFRSSTALANYDLSSNNNLFYAGIPSSRNVLLSVSTATYRTLNDLQGIVLPREVNSASENTSFLSTVASNSNFLKPDTTVASAIESGGVNISGITTDYEDDIRQGNAGTTSTGTAPDIGAFEQNGIRVINPVVVTGALAGNGTYATLGSAFNAINSGAQTSAAVTISIRNNTDELTSTAVLNAGAWTSLTITPDGARTIAGATTAGNPLINLNGADNVTINGLNTGGNSLTISNTTVSATAATSTIRFINDAINNTITNCTVSGSSTSVTTGTIFFSTGTTTGNDGNTISNCAITPAGSNLPVNSIYSSGTSVAIDNSGNIIHNNTIQDYFSPTLSSAGIHLSNSAAWTITNNKLFQTATRTVNANALTIRAIGVFTGSAGGYTINNNTIGFANASATGTTTYEGAFTTVYRGIDFTGNTTTSSIQGNTIAGINLTSSLDVGIGVGGWGVFSGIGVGSGSINIGTTIANIIGSTTDTGNIVINNTTTAAVRINGIYVASASATSAIHNNIISGFRSGSDPASGYSFIGISTDGASGNFTIRNNTIGSTTLANSIVMGNINTTSGVCTIQGISNAATGTISIDSNTVVNTAVFGTTAASSISGIVNTGGSSVSILSNLITNSAVAGADGISYGISNSAAASDLIINSNTIRGFSVTNSSASIRAIQNTGVVTSLITINDNKIGDATNGFVTYQVATSGSLIGIYNFRGGAACNLSIQNNDIRGITYTLASTGGSTYIFSQSAALLQNINISGNTFTNLNLNTNGNINFILNTVAVPANGSQTVNNNSIVTGFTNLGTAGTVTLYTTGGTSDTTATIINSGNNFSNITLAGSTSMAGWRNTDRGGCSKTISNNIFRNWTIGTGFTTGLYVEDNGINKTSIFNNNIENINAPDGIFGLSLGAYGVLNCYENTITNLACSSTTISVRLEGIRFQTFGASTSNLPNNIYNNTISNLYNAGGIGDNRTLGISTVGEITNNAISIYGNNISNISSNGTGNHQLFGLYLLDCKNGNVFKNKIYNIASNGIGSPTIPTVIGISLANLSTDNVWNVYNNLISDLKAPNTSSTNKVVIGIQLDDQDTIPRSALCNMYYNTIHINASSTGTDFGTAGIYHGNTRTSLDMRNNIISNSSTPNGAGKTVALLRSATGIAYDTNYLSISNSNLFYAGTPGSNNLLLSDSINNARTITELQTILSPDRESNSKSGAVTFISTNGDNIDFLRPDTTNSLTTSLLNNNGTNVSSVTDDYTNRARALTPDIGSYEFNINHYLWLGVDGNWNNPANWNYGSVPDGSLDIAILSGTAVLNEDLTIQTGKSLVVRDTGTLVIAPGKVLTVAGSANFGSRPVILKSDSTGSASIGQISGTLSEDNNVRVERYVPALTSPSSSNSYGRRWRFIGSPVENATLQDLRQEIFVTGPGTGSTVGTVNSNGFDATQNNIASVVRYNETISGSSSIGWEGVNHIDSVLVPGIGYRIFIRGDRNDTSRLSTNSITPQNNVTIDFRGTPNKGTFQIPLSFTNTSSSGDGWNMVGNPYPSAIDWNAIHDPGRSASGIGFTGTNYSELSHTIYIYNPVTNVYNSYNALSDIGTGQLLSGIIASGQAFFVKATAANPSLTLRESHKVGTTKGLFKNINNSSCRVHLIRDSFNRDEMVIKYINGATTLHDEFDSRLFPSSVNISAWGSDSVDLTISCRPTTTDNDTIRLNVAATSGTYTLRFENSNQIAISDYVTLVDLYTATATNLKTNSNYTFSINSSIPQSFGRNRFYIIISNQNPVPVNLSEHIAEHKLVSVYPNPNSGSFTLETNTDEVTPYELIDATGKTVIKGLCQRSYLINDLRTGIYMLKVTYPSGEIVSTKIVAVN